MTKPSQKKLQARVAELESLLNLMTEYAATHADGAHMVGSFAEKVTFEDIANNAAALSHIVEHCRKVLRGGA